MARLFPENLITAAASAEGQKTARKSENFARHVEGSRRMSLADLASLRRPFPNGPTHSVIGPNGTGNLLAITPSPELKAKSADIMAAAPECVQRVASQTSIEGIAFLSALVKRHRATNGEAIEFSTDEAARAMGCGAEQAGRVLTSLVQMGLITPRTNLIGGHAGYVPSFPQ